MSKRIVFLLLLLHGYVLAYSQQSVQDIETIDAIYEETIKSVLLYPTQHNYRDASQQLAQPIIALHSTQSLLLEFDDLTADFRGFRAKLVHCDAEWKQSMISEIEYTTSFNDYPVTEYSSSFSTKVPYYHYSFEVPKVKLSGNYLLVLFAEDTRKVVLTKRFLVYEDLAKVSASVNFANGIQERNTHQQIDFSINHRGMAVMAPQNDLKVVLRQNFRWDTAKSNFKPTQVNSNDQSIRYQFFALENAFPAGNEYRYFDSRTLAGRGFGVYEIERLDDFTRLILTPDKPRSNEKIAFSMDDLNGRFIVDHRESGNGSIEADYTPVVFTLKMPEMPDANVYVNGGFNNWQLNEVNKMEYYEGTQAYQAVILLKQGIVNYNYTIEQNNQLDEALVEGNFSSTENDYDVLVYFRAPAGRYDQFVGYTQLEWNRRN